MLRVNRGENVPIRLNIFDDDGVLFDPTTDPTINVTDPNGDEWLAATTMTRISTGKWYYNPSTVVEDLLGRYEIKYTIIDQGLTFIEYDEFTIGR